MALAREALFILEEIMEPDTTVGTETEEVQNDPAAQPETTEPSAPPTPAEPEAQPQKESSFFDPSKLSDELKPQWKKMHGAYTKKMQEFAATSKKAALVDQFNSDPATAIAIIQQRAQQLGYTLSKAQAADIATGQAQMPGQAAPENLVALIKSRLSPELQFMATDLANAAWVSQQAMMAPMKQEQAQKEAEERESEYDDHVTRLSEKYPGWEAHEDEMDGIMAFMESRKLTHPKYGSKLELLYKLASGDGAAIAEATNRMSNAARNRVNTGVVNRASIPNIEDRVRKAPNTKEAWEIAKEAARGMIKGEL